MTQSTPIYPNITVKLSGTDGNAMMIIGTVRATMRKEGVVPEELDKFSQEVMDGDYQHVLSTVSRWVNVQ